MKRRSERILSLALVAAMLLTMLNLGPTAPLKAQALAGEGTEESPYLISTAEELNGLRDYLGAAHVDKVFKLVNDIDLTDYIASRVDWDGKGWETIGSSSNYFGGILDGDGHKITGLWFRRGSNSALLGGVLYGTVKNLGVELDPIKGIAFDVSGGTGAALVANLNFGGAISNCYVIGDLRANIGSSSYYGLILGAYGSNAATSTVENCYAIGRIIDSGEVGTNPAGVGGLIGRMQANDVVKNSYAAVSVPGKTNCGALVGAVVATAAISDCYFNTDIEGAAVGSGTAASMGFTGVATEEMLDAAALTAHMPALGTAFEKRANDAENDYYPELKVFQGNGMSGVTVSKTPSTAPDGSAARPYLIGTAAQFSDLRSFLGASFADTHFKLTADIDLSGYIASRTDWGSGGWNPIGSGTGAASFYGTLNGDGHKITGLWLNRGGGSALFGHITDAAIENLGVELDPIRGIAISASGAGAALAAIAANSNAISNCYVVGDIRANLGSTACVGLLVGQFPTGVNQNALENCYAIGRIIDTKETASGNVGGVGGLVGRSNNSSAGAAVRIENCYAAVRIVVEAATKTNLGGLIGAGAATGTSTTVLTNGYYNRDLVANGVGGGSISESSTAPVGLTAVQMLADDVLTAETDSMKDLGGAFEKRANDADNDYYPELTVFEGRGKLGAAVRKAPGTEPDGTADKPYLIGTAAQLHDLRTFLGAAFADTHFKLTADIDLGDYIASRADWGDSGWEPIGTGTGANSFHGNLDGDGHKITGFWFDRGPNSALFGYTTGAVIKNLGLEIDRAKGIAIASGSGSSAALIANAAGSGTISNCYVAGDMTVAFSSSQYVGFLVGTFPTSGTGISNTIENCYAVGRMIESGASTGNPSGAGGLVGRSSGGSVVMQIKNSYAAVRITNATGKAPTGRTNVGGFVGSAATATTITDSYFNRSYHAAGIGTGTPAVTSVLTGRTTEQMLADNTLTATDDSLIDLGDAFEKRANEVAELYYPELAAFGGAGKAGVTVSAAALTEPDGTAERPYRISTAAELDALRGYTGASFAGTHFILTNDIDLTAYIATRTEWAGKGWAPIGAATANAFQGHLNGDGYKITGLWLNRGDDYNGLFGCLIGGSITNLGLELDPVKGVTVSAPGKRAAGLAAYAANGTTLSDCYVAGTIRGSFAAGAYYGLLVGQAATPGPNVTIQNCYAIGSIRDTGEATANPGGVGGILGQAQGSSASTPVTIRNSYAAVDLVNAAAPQTAITKTNCGVLVGVASGTANATQIADSYYVNDFVFQTGVGAGNAATIAAPAGVPAAQMLEDGVLDAQGSMEHLGSAFKKRPADTNNDYYPELTVIRGDSGMAAAAVDKSGKRAPDGTAANPYFIGTAAELNDLRNCLGAGYANTWFALKNNVDLSSFIGTRWPVEGWLPIGSGVSAAAIPDTAFCGNLDGNGYRITGLWMNRTITDAAAPVALFGSVVGSNNAAVPVAPVIQNLGLQLNPDRGIAINTVLTDATRSAGLVGYGYRMTVSNCYVTGKLDSRASYAGLLVGEAAGIALTDASNIENSYVVGAITMPAGPTGAVEAAGGGIVGYAGQTAVSNCYAVAAITGAAATAAASGALAGRGDIATVTVENCYYNADFAPGIVEGSNPNGNGVGSGLKDAVGGGAEPVTTEQMADDATLTAHMPKLQLAVAGGHAGSAYLKTPNDGSTKYYPELAVFAAKGSPGQVAAGGEPDGTKNRPYLISTPQDLWNLRNYLGTKSHNVYFALTNDIDLTAFLAENSPNVGWEPIGIGTSTSSAAFCGSLDGRGYRITGLWCKPSVSYGPGAAGLFGAVAAASGADQPEIKNLGIELDPRGVQVASIYGSESSSAALVAYAVNVNINNCYVIGNITSSTVNVGLLAGYLMGLNSRIENCYAIGGVELLRTGSGGSGGLAGSLTQSAVRNSYASVTVTYPGTMADRCGAIAGTASNATFNGCYYNSDYAAKGLGVAAAGVTGLTTVQMLADDVLATDMTALSEGFFKTPADALYHYYPELGVFSGSSPGYRVGMFGTEENPFKIATAEDLDNLRQYVGDAYQDCYFEVTQDIDLTGYIAEKAEWDDKGWLPIGDGDDAFHGHIRGNGHQITGLWVNRPEETYTGLFGRLYDAEILDLGVELAAAGITGSQIAGGLAGEQAGGVIDGCSVTGSGTVAVSQGAAENPVAGGLVGVQSITISGSPEGPAGPAYIRNSLAEVRVTANTAGGLVGYQSMTGHIEYSYASGTVTATDTSARAGGLVGYQVGAIVGCYALGSVTVTGAGANAGGLVAYQVGSIARSFAAAIVTGPSGPSGGFVGVQNQAGVGEISDSYYNRTMNPTLPNVGIAYNFSGDGQTVKLEAEARTTAQMLHQNALLTGGSMEKLGSGFSKRAAGADHVYYPELVSLNHTEASERNARVARIVLLPGDVTIAVDDMVYGMQMRESVITGKARIEGEDVSGTCAWASGVDPALIPTAGTHSFNVTFTPDNVWYKPVTMQIGLTVKKVTTAMTFTSNQPDIDGRITLFATVASAVINPGSPIWGDPAATITFKSGNTVLGTAPLILNGNPSIATAILNTTLTAGTHTLTAEYSGTANYNAQTRTIGGISIGKKAQAALVIPGGNVTAVYGGTPEKLTATGGSTQGAISFESADTGVVTVAQDGTLTIVGVGVTTVIAKREGDEVYNPIASAPITVTVNQAPLTITANDASRTTGANNPTFTVRYSGFVNGETEAVLRTLPTVTCAATSSSAAGTYPIVPSGAEADHYAITYVNGTLTVTAPGSYTPSGGGTAKPPANPNVVNSNTSGKTAAAAGQTVYATLSAGFGPDTLPYYLDENGKEIFVGLSAVGDGTLVFIAPITAEYFYKANPKTFTDVTSGFWGAPAVSFVTSRELFGGYGDGRLGPNDSMTRAMFVTVLARLHGVNPADYQGDCGFSDVPGGAWYEWAASWAARYGILNGVGGNRFAPHDLITREQMAVLILRYVRFAGLTLPVIEGNVTVFNDDAEISDWSKGAVYELNAAGVVGAYDDGSYAPLEYVSRLQVSYAIKNAVERALLGK